MFTVLTYFISLVVIVGSVGVTLYFKSELEKMFREKKEVVAFHVCNVLIILMASLAVHAVMAFMLEKEISYTLQSGILLLIILPIYTAGYYAYEKYKLDNRKYAVTQNGKVLIINEKYLRRK
ncbi:hypothetical protein [Bacillus sp. B-jedd]|uniref:hypothetical protein n=1 Tax=Bacillus sp. B-jedd TaxID=1476857 RepID=UPI0005156EAE|nr:hypothetical protein [Bacillus sp. B-jedd]CEG26470.1 hypothetical protein BN1002_01317 [Bacillus sp. B-jedd]